MEDILIRPFSDRDRETCLELYNYVYPENMSLDRWLWKNAMGTLGKSLIETSWDGERLLGMYGIIPLRLYSCGRQLKGGLSDIAVTHPAYRYRGIFGEMGRRLYKRAFDQGIEVVYGFPTEHSVHGFKKRLHWDYITTARPLFCWGCAAEERAAGEYEIQEVDQIGVEFDTLWEVLARGLFSKCSAVLRDAQYMRWRFRAEPGQDYRVFLALAGSGSPVGCAVTRRRSNGGEEFCEIADIMASVTGCFRYLVTYLKDKLDSPIMLKVPEGSLFYCLAKGMGFKEGGKNYYFGRRVIKKEAAVANEWFYTMSDSC